MVVVADSSPLIVLVNLRHVDVLPKLFAEIVIPPAVASELACLQDPKRSASLLLYPRIGCMS